MLRIGFPSSLKLSQYSTFVLVHFFHTFCWLLQTRNQFLSGQNVDGLLINTTVSTGLHCKFRSSFHYMRSVIPSYLMVNNICRLPMLPSFCASTAPVSASLYNQTSTPEHFHLPVASLLFEVCFVETIRPSMLILLYAVQFKKSLAVSLVHLRSCDDIQRAVKTEVCRSRRKSKDHRLELSTSSPTICYGAVESFVCWALKHFPPKSRYCPPTALPPAEQHDHNVFQCPQWWWQIDHTSSNIQRGKCKCNNAIYGVVSVR